MAAAAAAAAYTRALQRIRAGRGTGFVFCLSSSKWAFTEINEAVELATAVQVIPAVEEYEAEVSLGPRVWRKTWAT